MSSEAPDPAAAAADPSMRLQRLVNAQALAERTGRSGYYKRLTRKIGNVAGREGVDFREIDPTLDFNSPGFDQAEASGLQSVFNKIDKKRGRTPMRPGQFAGLLNTTREGNLLNERTQDWEDTGRPAFDAAEGELSRMISTPTYSAEYIANAKSKIAQMIREPATQRLQTSAALLGMRGMDASSPAGSALLGRMQMDADSELAQSLSDFDLKVQDIEESNLGREIALQASTIARRVALEAGIKDPSVLYNLQGEITGLMEALRAQREAEAYERDMARDAESFADRAGAWAGSAGALAKLGSMGAGLAAAPFTGGASLAGLGLDMGNFAAPSQPAPDTSMYDLPWDPNQSIY